VQHLKRITRRRLQILVVRNEPAACVRRQHLRRLEMLSRKRALPRAGHADEDDEREFGDREGHFSGETVVT
jgi:hypothetical protein